MAGYMWGQHGRSANDPNVQRQVPDFIRGVEDGYGDLMERHKEQLTEKSKQKRKTVEQEILKAEKYKFAIENFPKNDSMSDRDHFANLAKLIEELQKSSERDKGVL